MILKFFADFYINSILSLIRCVSIITHMMMIKMTNPDSTVFFFESLFEFVSFDFLPTDIIYGEMFNFDSEPYSKEAAEIGYESLLIIENSGSITILLFINLFQQFIFWGLSRVLPANNKARIWMTKSLGSYWWGGAISFYNEIYICMSFAAAINILADMRFNVNASITGNNIFALLFSALLLFGPIFGVYWLHKRYKVSEIEIDAE